VFLMRLRHASGRWASASVFALVAGLVALGANAHQPALADLEHVVDDPSVSHAIYGEFVDGDEVYTVRMTFETGFALPFELMIPHKTSLRDHRPTFAVIAPGLPPGLQAEVDSLPAEIEVPPGAGIFMDANDDPEREVIFESFTRRVFWSTGPTALALQPGECLVVVWSPEGTTGDFVLGLGVEEDFSEGFGDVFSNWGSYAY
jgi:hypothetical protein